MKKWLVVVQLLLPLGLTLSLSGQTCSQTAKTSALLCTLPQLYGPQGLILSNPNHAAHFQQASLQNFSQPITTSIGEELSSLPLGSAGSGISFTFNAQHVPVPTEDSLGPILTERAQVIGRQRVNLGVAYQYFDFRSIDGLSMKQLPDVLEHVQFSVNGSIPSYENDYITTSNTLGLHLNQIVLYGVYGLTNRIDVSAELPIETIHFAVSSSAHIVRTVACEFTATCTGAGSDFGEYHYFGNPTTNAQALANVDANFANGGNASGIGDVLLRAKGEIIKAEKSATSLGVSVRLPSGDATNLLGSGTVGVEPFAAFTYRGPVSPHVRVGYQWNGQSILPGNPIGNTATFTTGGPIKASLPAAFVYSGGADIRISDRLTIAGDLIGQRLFSAARISLGTFTDYEGNTLPQIQPNLGTDYSADSIAAGVKIRLARDLVLTGNVTTRVDNGGLVARVVPLAGLSYAF